MIEPEEIARWAELYDLGFNNLDMTSREADAARPNSIGRFANATSLFFLGEALLSTSLTQEAIRKIKAYLRRSQSG